MIIVVTIRYLRIKFYIENPPSHKTSNYPVTMGVAFCIRTTIFTKIPMHDFQLSELSI